MQLLCPPIIASHALWSLSLPTKGTTWTEGGFDNVELTFYYTSYRHTEENKFTRSFKRELSRASVSFTIGRKNNASRRRKKRICVDVFVWLYHNNHHTSACILLSSPTRWALRWERVKAMDCIIQLRWMIKSTAVVGQTIDSFMNLWLRDWLF